MTSRGRFITFEGIDGSGKSTQMRLLAERLRAGGRTVFENVEPGGSRIGQQIRRILLHKDNEELAPTAEMLLMFAARAQNVDGLGSDIVLDIDRIACRGLVPDATICVDIEPGVGLARARARASERQDVETRLEAEELAFYRKVRDGYAQIATEEPRRVHVIDGDRPPDEIAGEVWEVVAPLLDRL
jgi:dTMP kinase